LVELAFRGGAYVRIGDAWLLVAPVRAPAGPLSVLVRDAAPLAPGDWIRIDARRARVVPPVPAGPLQPGWQAALAAAVGEVPAMPPAIAQRIADPEALPGLGEGLTPAGDDVLAGYAAWRHAGGEPVRIAAGRCSPIGRAYLRCAERGELPDVAARVLQAVRAGDAGSAARRARGLARWGASSGGAILWGMAAAAGRA
jgi:hypothetical protein